MAIRPVEKKIFKWKYAPEKEDKDGMVWHIEPEVFEGRLNELYMQGLGDTDSFDSFVHNKLTTHIKKLEIPNGKVPNIVEKPDELDKIIRRLPRQYGDALILAVQGIDDFLDEGLVGN